MVTDLMMPALGSPSLAQQNVPALRATTSMPAIGIVPSSPQRSTPQLRATTAMPAIATGTDGQPQNVDWARFTATVQSAIRRTEH